MNNETSKVKTYLPMFPGFYDTIFEADTDIVIEDINKQRKEKGLKELEFNDFEFDYNTYNTNVSIACCKFIKDNFKDYVTNVEYEELISPREYNFKTDTIHVIIELSDENKKNIIKTIEEDEEFKIYLNEQYTSRDGFISFYSNNIIDWISNWDETMSDKHKLGSILDYIATLNYTIEDMYESCECYPNVTNYEELLSKQI